MRLDVVERGGVKQQRGSIVGLEGQIVTIRIRDGLPARWDGTINGRHEETGQN